MTPEAKQLFTIRTRIMQLALALRDPFRIPLKGVDVKNMDLDEIARLLKALEGLLHDFVGAPRYPATVPGSTYEQWSDGFLEDKLRAALKDEPFDPGEEV